MGDTPAGKPASQLIPALLIIALTLAAFWPALSADFLNYDDNVYITENALVAQGLTAQGVVAAFLKPQNAGWNPLATISHMTDVQLFGMNPGAHHAVNILLHLLNSLLLMHVLAALTGDRTRSAWAAVLFAVLPLHVEPVAWISSRKDVLSTFFMLLAIDSYARAVRRPTLAAQLRTLFVYALALLAKPMVITLPALLLLLDFWPLRRLGGTTPVLAEKKRALLRCVVEKIPYFTLSILVAGITFVAQRAGGAVRDFSAFPLAQRIGNAVVSCWSYVADVFWPAGLAPYYPHPGNALSAFAVAWGAIFVVAVSLVAVGTVRRAPYIATGWFWYLIALLPVIGIAQIGSFARADRFAYVPTIGLLVALVWAFSDLVRQRAVQGAMLAIAALACTWAANAQVQLWHDSIALFTHTANVTRDNAVANSNLGVALLRRAQHAQEKAAQTADLQAAETHLQEAVRIAPDFADAHNNLGLALDAQEKPGAREQFEIVLKLDPRNAKAMVNLGNAAFKTGDTAGATEWYEKAIAVDASDFDAHYNLGITLLRGGQVPEAVQQLQSAASLRPDSSAAHTQLAAACLSAGDVRKGIAAAARAVQLDTRDPEAHYQLGVALTLSGDLQSAEKQFRDTLELNPGHAMAHYNLGAVLGNLRRLDEAKAEFEKTVQLDPKNVQARQALEMMSQGADK